MGGGSAKRSSFFSISCWAARAEAIPSVPRGRLPDLENRRFLLDRLRNSVYT
jgi:hypothetical protein